MIVVTTPTGNIGRQVVSWLIAAGAHVRVIARDPSKLPKGPRGRFELVEGAHDDAATLARALEGAKSLFWLPPGDMTLPSPEAAYVDFARPLLGALQDHPSMRVVGVSALGRGWPKQAGHVTATLKADDLISETGVPYRALCCGSLMENILRQRDMIAEKGVFFWPSPSELKLPYVATRDVAAVAARLLLDETWTGHEELQMPGPEDLSFDQMAQIMSDTLQKPVSFQEIGMEDMRGMLIANGASAGMARSMIQMLTAKNAGLDHMAPRAFAAETPTTFREWCRIVLEPAIVAAEGRP
ncbi:NmrA family transcriptional regulator [Mesobaculum littorinae]|uniref:NmrA family transcriptional regulator n=1 Tax=Mesobaculum littorinae TaxID=2486419 RepID=A0A438AEP7_9RHOB|nr:NmrA family NAD(P)-binding protein [Mesobaculum littorinae]RVV97164.1 NmrA family transcriptional regulator [Mesobaculum littorinae]